MDNEKKKTKKHFNKIGQTLKIFLIHQKRIIFNLSSMNCYR